MVARRVGSSVPDDLLLAYRVFPWVNAGIAADIKLRSSETDDPTHSAMPRGFKRIQIYYQHAEIFKFNRSLQKFRSKGRIAMKIVYHLVRIFLLTLKKLRGVALSSYQ